MTATIDGVGIEDGQKYKVRLMGVDTPEVDFNTNPKGKPLSSARFLDPTCSTYSVVTFRRRQKDKHGRILGLIVSNGVGRE